MISATGALVLAGTLAPAVSSPAIGATNPCAVAPTIHTEQPLDKKTLKVARISGSDAAEPDEWELNHDTWWCNLTSTTYDVASATFSHLDKTKQVIRTVEAEIFGDARLEANRPIAGIVHLRILDESGQFAFPLPAAVTVTFSLVKVGEGSGPGTVEVSTTHKVAEHVSPKRGYFLWFRQADLPAGSYWSHGRHGSNNSQRWALDTGVARWTGSEWTDKKPGGDGRFASDFLTWEQPIYAMSDGEIIGCNRGAPDNLRTVHFGGPPAAGNVPGGNVLWIRSGKETTLYAHLRHNSIPSDLCPFDDDAEHPAGHPTKKRSADKRFLVKAGDFLGLAGNSGNSTSHTHLHIHAFRGLPRIAGGSEGGIDADGRPLHFFAARVQPLTESNVNDALWKTLDPAAQLAYFSRITEGPCGSAPQCPL